MSNLRFLIRDGKLMLQEQVSGLEGPKWENIPVVDETPPPQMGETAINEKIEPEKITASGEFAPECFRVGDEWRTRDGRKAIIISNSYSYTKKYNVKIGHALAAIILNKDSMNRIEYYISNGRFQGHKEHKNDLVGLWRDPVKVEAWALVSLEYKRIVRMNTHRNELGNVWDDELKNGTHVLVKLTGTEGEE